VKDVDLSMYGGDWILCDILDGLHLLPHDYALAQIEKLWLNLGTHDNALMPRRCIAVLERIGTAEALDALAQIAQTTCKQQDRQLVTEMALRAIQMVSPVGQENWLIKLLQRGPKASYVIQRAIDMLGMTGNLQALPVIQQYFENHPSERVKYIAFWAIHNIYKAVDEVWYNGEEVRCL
jgi:HEAT repeat protein